jgi:peroxiredoxin
LLVMHNLSKTDTCNFKAINDFAMKAQKDGAKFFGISSSAGEEVEEFRFRNQTPFDFLSNDGTELKIIVRSNPGLVYIEKGIVKDMWSNADIPEYGKK